MHEHRRVSRLFTTCLVCVGSALLVPSVALAGPKDKSATALANQAMQTDYVATKFKKAEQKLKKALAQCGDSACSYDVVGRLHRDLATVYIGGLNQPAKGKAELKRALAANPDLQLDKDFGTPELTRAFKEAGGHGPKEEAEEEPEEKPAKVEKEDCEPGSEGCDRPKEEPEAKPNKDEGKGAKNWLSLGFQQDFLFYGAQNDVCASNTNLSAGAANYSCYQDGLEVGGLDIAPGAGNRVSGGVGRATSRILLGFDRVLTSNISLGLRVGFAFGGGPASVKGGKFFPLHAELRANYWFGRDPFESAGVRPYLSLSGGLAQVDGHVLVEYYDTSLNKGSLDAWRRTGKGFAGLGFGVMIPFLKNTAIVPEARVKQMFGASGTGFDLSLGLAQGF